jgi:hypothetical protein
VREDEIREAVALQDERMKRGSPCGGVIGIYHRWARFDNPKTGKSYEACSRCSVSGTSDDYAIKQEEA